MTNAERNPQPEWRTRRRDETTVSVFGFRYSFGFRHSSFGFRAWSLVIGHSIELLLRLAQPGEHAEILQRGGVAFDFCAGGDLLEQAAHDFSRARFGQRLGESNIIRPGHRPDFLGDVLAEFVAQEIGP